MFRFIAYNKKGKIVCWEDKISRVELTALETKWTGFETKVLAIN